MSSVDKTKMTNVDREELVKLARRISDLTFQIDCINAKAYSISKAIDKILIKSRIDMFDFEDEKFVNQIT